MSQAKVKKISIKKVNRSTVASAVASVTTSPQKTPARITSTPNDHTVRHSSHKNADAEDKSVDKSDETNVEMNVEIDCKSEDKSDEPKVETDDKSDAKAVETNVDANSKPEAKKRGSKPGVKNKPKTEDSKPEYYSIDISDVPSSIAAVHKFMALNPKFFKTSVSKTMLHFNENSVRSVYTEPIHFNDAIHKTKGYIVTSLQNTSCDSSPQGSQIKNQMKMQIFINKARRKTEECYVKQVENYVADQTKFGNNVELSYYKILSDCIVRHVFYNESLEQWNKDVVTLKNEYFSKHKEHLFAIMEHKFKFRGIGNVSSSWNNLILEGKPGSGKSSCIYRIAMMLKLNILSVDLSMYLNKKRELYTMFHGQEFCLPSNSKKEPAIHNCIIVLEEFDNAIDKLVNIEEIFKYKDSIKTEFLKMKNDEIKAKNQEIMSGEDVRRAAHAYLRKREDEYIRKKELEMNDGKSGQLVKQSKKLHEMNFDELMKAEQMEDGIDLENNLTFEKAKQHVLGRRDFENQLAGINGDLNNMIMNMDEDNKSNILRLYDLLELFQGPVPIRNRMIIATTNHFPKIREALPQLFRAGRMTPIHFENIDWDTLGEMTEYYFQSRLSCEPRPVTIPTSQVVETVIKYFVTKRSFEEFERELIALLDATA